jgi:ribonuclease P protein component
MESLPKTFSKKERLCSRKIITGLFESGNEFFTPHFKVIWDLVQQDDPAPSQVMFSVSKRNFRLAVQRNLIKRRMREAFRKQKSIIYDPLSVTGLHIAFIVIYRNSKINPYSLIETAMGDMLRSLADSIKKKTKNC